MPAFENHAGFTISASRLQLVEVNFRNDQFTLENVDEAYFNEPLKIKNDKETKTGTLLQTAFNELVVKHPLKSTNASFTLPFELFYMMQVPYDNTLLNEDLVEEFRWEFSVLYPGAGVKDLVIQYIEIEKNELSAYNTALVVGIPRRFLQIIHSFCQQNNLKLKFIDNIHTASDRALALTSHFTEQGLNLSVYLGSKFISLFFLSGGKPVYHKLIPVKDAGEITSVISEEITQHESFKIDRNNIDSAFIAGENLSASFVKTLGKSLGINFIYFNPFEKIKVDSRLFDNTCYTEKFNSFSSAAGIAYRLA